jgi:hypothetical protein
MCCCAIEINVAAITDFVKQYLTNDIIEQIRSRRKSFYDSKYDAGRSSIAEWLEVYPFSQRPEISTWAAHRRVIPSRPVGMDRRLLNIGFKIPARLKLDDKIFVLAAKNIYGRGAYIPNANDGVRPGSGHWWRLIQRTARKLQNRTSDVLEKFGKEKNVQHSWHDYQKYWRESEVIRKLIEEYGSNLDEFNGVLFAGRSQDLLQNKNLYWRAGFRLLQMAIWLGVRKNYTLIS